jgi:hypothetical protein
MNMKNHAYTQRLSTPDPSKGGEAVRICGRGMKNHAYTHRLSTPDPSKGGEAVRICGRGMIYGAHIMCKYNTYIKFYTPTQGNYFLPM